jgi:hypothetical protein
MSSQKRSFGRRINAWLDEAAGETFRDGKWRFWFIALIVFSILNAVLTAVVFGQGGNLQSYMGTILVGVGALLAWLGVGALHYSDSTDPRLSRGVSILDSVTLVFMVAHFSFLLWVYGHISTLQHAEADYKAAAERYNAEARQVQADNARIADALRQIAAEESKRAKIENDTIYQARRAAQAGAKVRTGRGSQSLGANLSTSPVELEKPPAPPKDSSADFLIRWDSWIRLANFGELALAIVTLIFIRVRSAMTNAPRVEEFPREIDAGVVRDDRTGRRLDRTRKSDSGRLSPISGDPDARKDALKTLREHLKQIAFYHPGVWFKADLIRGGVTIRLFKKEHSHEIMVARTDQSDKLLAAVNRPDFRERLLGELIYQGFPLDEVKG